MRLILLQKKPNDPAALSLKNRVRGAASLVRAKGFEFSQKDAALRARTRITRIRADARQLLGGAQYEEFLQWTTRFLKTQAPILESSSYSFKEIGTFVTKAPLSLDREIAAACSRLSESAEVINEFRKHADELEKNVWLDDIDAIRATLGGLESTFGQSLWLIQANVTIKQLLDGLEAQKTYVQSIRKEAKGSLSAYFAHYISVKNEPTVTSTRFAEDMSNRLGRTRISQSEKIFLNLRLADNWPSTDRGLASVLQVEQTTSIVDLYETLIRILQRIVSAGPAAPLKPAIVSGLRKLSAIKDPRISKIFFALDRSRSSDDVLEIASDKSFELLLSGRSSASRDEANNELTKNIVDPNELLTVAFCNALTDQETSDASRIGQLVRAFSGLYNKSEDFDRLANDAARITRNLSFLPSFKALRQVSELESFPRSSETLPRLRLRYLNNRKLDPRDAISGLDIDVDLIEDTTTTVSSLSAAFAKNAELEIQNTKLRPDIASAIQTLKGLSGGRKHDIVAICQLARSDDLPRPIRIMISLRLIQHLIQEGEVGTAADQLSFEFVREPAILRVLPLADLIGTDGWRALKAHAKQISVPIVLNLQWRETNDDQDATNRRFAIQQFLSKNGFKKPSEIDPENAPFSKPELIYFLRDVCVATAIDMLPALTHSSDIDEERKRICEILVRLDPKRSNVYQDEILKIINKRIVQSGLQIVDRSRVHVDTDSIIRWAKKELEESYFRYQTLVDAGIGIAENFDDVLKRILRAEHHDEYLQLPTSEADELLIEMISSLKEQFLFDGSHGLDSYLSQRIRHGSIQNYLRSPVETAQLVTLKTTTGGKYETNKYWLEKLVPTSLVNAGQVQKIFQEFGQEFDGLILELKDRHLNVQSKEKPEGLLRMEITSPQFHILRSVIQSVDTIENFARLCVPFFWGILEPSLKSTRFFLATDIKRKFALTFEALRIKLRDAVRDDSDGYAELSTAIGDASAKVQSELDRIVSWLERQEVQESQQEYTLRQAFDVAIESVLSSHKTFTPKLELEVSDQTTVSAGELIVIADVMRVTLGNVDAHANTKGPPTVRITASINDSDETLTIRCESNIGRGVKNSEAERRLQSIRERIEEGSFSQALRSEGGSGLMRLAHLVRQSSLGRLSFGFEGNSKFVVEVDLSFFRLEPTKV